MALIVNGRGIAGIRSGVSAGPSTPSIIYDGLKLYLDAGNVSSYPGTGTLWTDLSGNGNNGTLTNGPTYNSSNGGSITFDGVDDYVLGTSNVNLSNNFTLQIAIKPDTLASGNIMHIGEYQGSFGANSGWYIGIDNRPSLSVGNSIFISIGNDSSFLYSAQNALITNNINIYIVSFVCTNGRLSLYVNGVQTSGLAVNNTVRSINYLGTNFFVGNRSVNSANYKGSFYNYLLYNRALSATEVLLNYNALKGRFGL
jgi:hypothetical protein